MSNKVSCCKDCEDRHYNCHAECEKYQDQRGLLYKHREDEPYCDYWSERTNKIVHKKHIKKRR